MASRFARRHAARICCALATVLVSTMTLGSAQQASAGTAMSGQHALNNGHAHGKHGRFSFPDSSKPGTGVDCHYSGGQLTSVTLASPLAAGRAYWLRGQYIPWKGKLQRKQGNAWKLVAVGHGDDSKPIKPRVLTARPPMVIKIKHGAPGGGVYRVVEKLMWIANLPGGPEEGYAKHVIAHYHVAFGDQDRPFCEDAMPTVSPPRNLSVIGGDTLNLDPPGLLGGAHQADGDPLRVYSVSVTEDGVPWDGATVSRNGRLRVETSTSDTDQRIVVRYRVVDAAGRTSTPVSTAIAVTNVPPVAVDQTFGPASSGQPLTVPAPGLLTGATGPGLSVSSADNPSFDPVADGFVWSSDGSFTITPTAADVAAGSITFDYTVTDSRGKTSAPATATIEIAPTAVDQEFDGAVPGQQFDVPAPGLLTGANGPGLSVGSVTNADFDVTADAFSYNAADGSFTITPQHSEAGSILQFTYTVVNSHNVNSAPATVTIPVAAHP